jgi:hypothetical protein
MGADPVSTLAQKLRDIADQLEAVDITGMTPTPGGDVVEGDVIWPQTRTSMQVTRIEAVENQPPNRYGAAMLRIWGTYIVSPDHVGVESTHIAYADEWIVVER